MSGCSGGRCAGCTCGNSIKYTDLVRAAIDGDDDAGEKLGADLDMVALELCEMVDERDLELASHRHERDYLVRAFELVKRLMDIDWCIGYSMTDDQLVELDDIRTTAYQILTPLKQIGGSCV